ncbi:MAG TPA: Rap1a/Tai family immunity protein [Azonexus sp.]
MKAALFLLAALGTGPALAYSSAELRGDCQAADALYQEQKSGDPHEAIRSARCIAYVAGFADGYAVSDYLAEKVGVRLNAFCLPKDDNLSPRLVRAVLGQLERLPPNDNSTATIVAGALARTFPCPDSLEPRK